MLERQQRKDIISYRIEKSHKSFEEAKAISKLGYSQRKKSPLILIKSAYLLLIWKN